MLHMKQVRSSKNNLKRSTKKRLWDRRGRPAKVRLLDLLLTSIAVVVGVTGHHSTSMKVCRENKTLRPQPANHCLDLKHIIASWWQRKLKNAVSFQSETNLSFPSLLKDLLTLDTSESIREVPVQINAVAVVPDGEKWSHHAWKCCFHFCISSEYTAFLGRLPLLPGQLQWNQEGCDFTS